MDKLTEEEKRAWHAHYHQGLITYEECLICQDDEEIIREMKEDASDTGSLFFDLEEEDGSTDD